MDPYHRPIDPRLRLRCNRLVNGQSTRGGQHDRSAPSDSGILWPLKHQQRILDDVNVHVGKERTYDKQQA